MLDSVYTHDFGNSATWYGGGSLGVSAWILEPPPGRACKILACEVKASVNCHMSAAIEIWFQCKKRLGGYGHLPPTANDGPSYCVSYGNMRDWVKRGTGIPEVVSGIEANNEFTAPLMLVPFTFAPAPTLWSSSGKDDNGMPKFNRMIIRIVGNQPIKTLEGNPIDMAIAKYSVDWIPDE